MKKSLITLLLIGTIVTVSQKKDTIYVHNDNLLTKGLKDLWLKYPLDSIKTPIIINIQTEELISNNKNHE
jgi:hypothetical protein